MPTFTDVTNITENNPQGNTQNPSSSAINVNSLGNNQTLTIPGGSNTLQQLLQQLLGGAQTTSSNIEAQLTSQQSQQEKDTNSAFNNYITSLSGGNLADQYSKLAESSGLNANTKQLGELNQQITNRTNALTKALQAAEDTNVFAGFAQGEQGRINKAAAVELGALSASAQALQGNITLAKDTIKQTLEFADADKKREIEARKMFYEVNKDKLSETTKSLLAVQLKKDERANKAIEDLNSFKEKAWETASKNGAPTSVLTGILNADSKDNASKAMETYGVDELDRSIKQLQRTKLLAEIDENKRTGGKKPLSGDAAKVLAIANTLPQDIAAIKEAFTKDYNGALRGYILGTNRDLVKLIGRAADKVGRLRSGGAINKEEEARFTQQFASGGDLAFGSLENANNALDSILVEAQLVSNGIDPDRYYTEQLSGVLNTLAGSPSDSTGSPQYTSALNNIYNKLTLKK